MLFQKTITDTITERPWARCWCVFECKGNKGCAYEAVRVLRFNTRCPTAVPLQPVTATEDAPASAGTDPSRLWSPSPPHPSSLLMNPRSRWTPHHQRPPSRSSWCPSLAKISPPKTPQGRPIRSSRPPTVKSPSPRWRPSELTSPHAPDPHDPIPGRAVCLVWAIFLS